MSWFSKSSSKKIHLTIIDTEWSLIADFIKSDYLPRINEYINFKNGEDYYQVMNVIHVYDDKNRYIIVTKIVKKEKIKEKT